MRRRAAVLVGAGVLVWMLTGCGIPGTGAPHPDAVPVDAVICLEPSEGGHDTEPGAVPTGFDPVALVRCDPYASQASTDGTYAGARLERFEGDLTPVLEALATPNDPPAYACPAIGYMLPDLWLEDADGRAIRVALPRAGCGPKDVGIDEAIATLTRVSDEFVASSLIESAEAAAAGCATQAGMLVIAGPESFDTEDVPETDVVPEDDLVPWEPPALPDPAAATGVRACEYATEPRADPSGAPVSGDAQYTAVHRSGAEAAASIIRLVITAAPSRGCTATATRLAVVHVTTADGDAPAITVELDGCQRISDRGLRTPQAPPELIAALTP